MLVMKFSIRTYNQTVIYTRVYEVATAKNVIDKSMESLCSTSQKHAQKFFGAKKGDDSDFKNVISNQGNLVTRFNQIGFSKKRS